MPTTIDAPIETAYLTVVHLSSEGYVAEDLPADEARGKAREYREAGNFFATYAVEPSQIRDGEYAFCGYGKCSCICRTGSGLCTWNDHS